MKMSDENGEETVLLTVFTAMNDGDDGYERLVGTSDDGVARHRVIERHMQETAGTSLI